MEVTIPEGTTATFVVPADMVNAVNLRRSHTLNPGQHIFSIPIHTIQ
ncbi:hypothetical protein P9222_21150 [Paenibacillus amylolyticus]|nr:hypothetical protein [Paenibacillus amylolyticus]WFR61013.1 hypothetical protein P9222_21150 [Paenibacillus amylolyticus]